MKNSILVCGVGVNDGSYQARINGKLIKEYALWKSMIERCHDTKAHIKYPAYIGCSVSDNFLNYSYFYEWCQDQTGFGEIDASGRHWDIDKDIIIRDNKLYSEDTCVFVPHEINVFFIDRGNDRGEWPIGVSFHKASGKFSAQCSVNGKQQNLGLFETKEDAHTAYKKLKERICRQTANKWRGKIDHRVYEAMMNWVV